MLMGMERVGSRRISLHRDGRGLLTLVMPMPIAGADGNVVTVNQIQLWAGQGQALPRAQLLKRLLRWRVCGRALGGLWDQQWASQALKMASISSGATEKFRCFPP